MSIFTRGKMAVYGYVIVSALTLVSPSSAAVVAPGFTNGGTLPRNDDGAYGAFDLGFTANYFGTSYTQTYISNNGYLTFNSPQGTFTPFGLGASYLGQPIIAPFFADVDTRPAAGGTVTYGTGMYNGGASFGVTWTTVGYFADHTDLLNTFQVILTNRGSGNFDIYFNYDQIQWETGDASSGRNGLGGASAAAGYSKGTGVSGTYGELTGSLVNGAFLDGGPNALISNSNDGVTGQYLFRVTNGQVISSGVPEPSTWAMMIAGFVGLGFVARRKRNQSKLAA